MSLIRHSSSSVAQILHGLIFESPAQEDIIISRLDDEACLLP